MSTNLLSVRNLSKVYRMDTFAGFKNIDFHLNRGEVLAIVGESGSGKSTLLKALYGLITPDQGEVQFKGLHVKGPEEQLIPGHKQMKMVTQNFDLNLYAKVYDNIASQLSNSNLSLKAEKTEAMMQHLRIAHLSQRRVAELSGGEQQRVAIARALIHEEVAVLLLDEPFSQIDVLVRNQLRIDLRRLAKTLNTAIILVSHDPADGLSMADKLLVMRRGEALQWASPQEIYQNPKHVYTAALLAQANVFNATEALQLGEVIMESQQLVIYPEWIHTVANSQGALLAEVEQQLFKGGYEELYFKHQGLSFMKYQYASTPFIENGQFYFKISRSLIF